MPDPDAETKKPKADPGPKMIRCTVAPGHTVVTGLPPHRWEGKGDERRKILKGTQKSNGPGTLIELPEDEYLHNLERGFVLDPEGMQLAPNGLGPVFDRDLTNGNPAAVGGQNTMISSAAR